MPTFVCTILGGPNGSGKSSAFGKLKLEGKFINADEIAKTLPAVTADNKSVERRAGEIALGQIAAMIAAQESFVFETTLASHQSIKAMREAKAAGFKVDLYYVILDSPQRNVERVRFRVGLGGHDIPEQKIVQRYSNSLEKLIEALRIADEVVIVDNSLDQPQILFEIENGVVQRYALERGSPLHSLLSSKVCEAYDLIRYDSGFRKSPPKTMASRMLDYVISERPNPAPSPRRRDDDTDEYTPPTPGMRR